MSRRAIKWKLGDSPHVIFERADLEVSAEILARFVDSRHQARIGVGMIGSFITQDRCAVGELALAARNLFGARNETLDRFERQVRAVRIAVGHIDSQHR